MYTLLYSLVIGCVAALLFLNIYFRLKVFKHYKYLVQHRVDFPSKYILDKQKLEELVLPKYPQHASQIQSFAQNIRQSIMLAAGIILLIGILGAVIKGF